MAPQGAAHNATTDFNRLITAQELLKEMEGLAENGEWAELEAALQRLQGAPNDAATNLRYAAIRAGPLESSRGFVLCQGPGGCGLRPACCVLRTPCPACCVLRSSHAAIPAAWLSELALERP